MMMNCFTPRAAPAEGDAHNGTQRDRGGKVANGDTSDVEPVKHDVTVRRDGRGSYDMRQVSRFTQLVCTFVRGNLVGNVR